MATNIDLHGQKIISAESEKSIGDRGGSLLGDRVLPDFQVECAVPQPKGSENAHVSVGHSGPE